MIQLSWYFRDGFVLLFIDVTRYQLEVGHGPGEKWQIDNNIFSSRSILTEIDYMASKLSHFIWEHQFSWIWYLSQFLGLSQDNS